MGMEMGYKIIYPMDKNKLIELGHMIKGTYPSKRPMNDKPTLKLRHWRTLSGSSLSPAQKYQESVQRYQQAQRAMKLRELGKMIKGL